MDLQDGSTNYGPSSGAGNGWNRKRREVLDFCHLYGRWQNRLYHDQPNFLADGAYPNDAAGLEVATTPGYKTYAAIDAPLVGIVREEAKHVTEVRDVMEARNFLMVKVGDKDWQVLAQADWSYTNVATGKPSGMSGGNFPTTISWKDKASKPDPLFKKTKPGKTTTDAPITPPSRNPTAAVSFIGVNANWTVIVDSPMARHYRNSR